MFLKRSYLLLVFCAFLSESFAQMLKFDFGTGKIAKGYVKVDQSSVYDETKGYGFDFQTMPSFKSNRSQKDKLKNDCAYSNGAPFYFSVNLPEGNYKITAIFGDYEVATLTTVKAESRRLMVENLSTQPGEFKEEVIVVNIKDKKINEHSSVTLKPREKTKLDWDNKLTLEFDLNTYLCALSIEKADNCTTLFLAGNSTVVNQEEEPWASWGQMITRFFNDSIAIANHAESGLTLGSFLNSGRLQKILSVAKPNDYLFIEFGHNDQKEKGENAGAYKSYAERLRYFVSEFRKVGGIPVIVTSTSRRAFDQDGNLIETLGDFPDAARKVAKQLDVPLIDLNLMTSVFYTALGQEGSKAAFVHYPAGTFPNQTNDLADNTHFNTYGAYEISKMVLQGIKDNQLGIKKFIKDFSIYNPAKPMDPTGWEWPLSPVNSLLKPDGN